MDIRIVDKWFKNSTEMERFFMNHYDHGAEGDAYDVVTCQQCNTEWVYVDSRHRRTAQEDKAFGYSLKNRAYLDADYRMV